LVVCSSGGSDGGDAQLEAMKWRTRRVISDATTSTVPALSAPPNASSFTHTAIPAVVGVLSTCAIAPAAARA